MPPLRDLVTAIVLLVAMCLAGYVGRRQRIGSVILALMSVAWLTVDHDWEGAVIDRITPGHGLTVADLFGIAGLLAAAWLWLRAGRRA